MARPCCPGREASPGGARPRCALPGRNAGGANAGEAGLDAPVGRHAFDWLGQALPLVIGDICGKRSAMPGALCGKACGARWRPGSRSQTAFPRVIRGVWRECSCIAVGYSGFSYLASQQPNGGIYSQNDRPGCRDAAGRQGTANSAPDPGLMASADYTPRARKPPVGHTSPPKSSPAFSPAVPISR